MKPKGELLYGWDRVETVIAEPNWRDLIELHYELLNRNGLPLEPDYKKILAAEAAGIFRVWTARTAEGRLVGYVAFFIQPHIHYRRSLFAVEDLFLLHPDYRKGMAGYRLFSTVIAALKALKVECILLHTKEHYLKDRGGLGAIFSRLGFTSTDRVWMKVIS